MTQWFNNIIEISKLGYKYVDIVTTSNGDLIIIASTGSTDEPNKYKRNIYKLKNDGHRYYVGNYTTEDNFYEINAGTIREFGNIFSIKFKHSANNKEYIMGISSYGFEIYNLEKGTIFEETIFDYQQLYEFVNEKIAYLEQAYLIFDEIQRVKGWEKAINAFFVGSPVDIYISDSNNSVLSETFLTTTNKSPSL